MNLTKTLAIAVVAVLAEIAMPTANAAVLKKIVAVSRFENKAAYRGQMAIGDGMADQLTDALMQTGQFTVMERQNVKDVMQEQDFANSGRVQKAASAQTGKLTSAQILVQGTVTEFEAASSGSGGGKSSAHVGLIIRMLDTTTGEVLFSQRVEGKAESSSVVAGAKIEGVSFGGADFKKTPMGKAVQEAINHAVDLIADKLKGVPFEARVIKVNGDNELLISGGGKAGVSEGDVFTLYSVGESLVDPSTGEQLGAEVDKKGTVTVYKVEEKYAKAKSDVPLAGIKAGDMVRAEKK